MRSRNRQPHVYIAQVLEGGPIKIGISINAINRWRSLSNWCPYDMALICAAPGTKYDELALHRTFRSHRRRGEWFHPHPDVLAMADVILKAGALPDAILELGLSLQARHKAGERLWPSGPRTRRVKFMEGIKA